MDLSASVDGLLSSNRAVRTSELKRLERTVIPQLDEKAALELLSTVPPGPNGGEALGKVLLTIVGSNDAAEICREKAAIVLRGLLQKAFRCRSRSAPPDAARPSGGTEELPLNPSEYLGNFYVDFCSTFQNRISPPPSSSLAADGTASSPSSSVEPSEEIRLVLVSIASELLTYMDSLGICRCTSSTATADDDEKQRSSLIDAATSMLCRAVAKRGLTDPYPDLKRECCAVLGKLAKTFPRVVRMHAEVLLRPITGGSAAYNTASGVSGGLGLESSSTNKAANSTSLSASLIRHRHAKTRCLAIETSAAIVSCCPTGDDEPADKGSRGGTLQDILQSHVLSCWEDMPPFDRSALVRIALIRAIGSVSRLMAADFAVSAVDLPATFERHQLPSTPRLIVLLLMGMSDDSASVSSVAIDECSMLGRPCMPIGAAADVEESSNACTGTVDATRSNLVAVQADSVLTILLHDISQTWANERKIKGLNALEVFINLMDRSINCEGTTEQSSISCLESKMSEIVATLCSCFAEDEGGAILKAASSCARVLGKDSSLICPALAVLLPSLSGPIESNDASPSASNESNGAAKSQKRILLSEPQHFAAALSLLGCLLRGANLRPDGTPPAQSSDCLSFTQAREISAALNTASVLDAASSTQASAWALLDACQALCDCIPASSFGGNGLVSASNSKDSNDLQSAIAVDSLTCVIHLLGCPGQFGMRNQTLELFDDIVELHSDKKARADLMRLYFRDVLKLLLDSSHVDGDPFEFRAWQPGDRRLLAFDALLRNSGGCAVGENFDLVAPVLESHLANADTNADTNEESASVDDYTVKLSIMALLESTVSDPSFPKELVQPFTAKLLSSVIMPNLVWKVGGMAAALRKVSAAALFSLLRGGSATAESLFVSAPRLLPVLKSNLTDDDASTRELICSSLGIVFELIPGALGEEAVKQLYPDLVKCLDDSSDSVRFAACSALKHFLRAAHPSHLQGTAINHMVDQLLIHMDDPNHDFQKAAMEVLTVALGVDQNVVIEKTLAARSTHRSGEFCSLLLRKADERTAASKVMSS